MSPRRGAEAAAGAVTPLSAGVIGHAAARALHDELALAPKPGLVSFVDSGSHADMDATTFLCSLFALRPAFEQMAALGALQAPFEALQHCGVQAETRMLAATGGINTHRGAIFTLGLLCASAGALQAAGQALTAAALRASLLQHWGAALAQRSRRPPTLPGGLAAQRHGLRSASEEAALGLPALFEHALPAWRAAHAAGLRGQRLQLQVFFTLLARLDDCCIAQRGGLQALHDARALAHEFLAAGGAAAAGALPRAWALHRHFVQRRLSPGGCADMLAAACLVQRLGALV